MISDFPVAKGDNSNTRFNFYLIDYIGGYMKIKSSVVSGCFFVVAVRHAVKDNDGKDKDEDFVCIFPQKELNKSLKTPTKDEC